MTTTIQYQANEEPPQTSGTTMSQDQYQDQLPPSQQSSNTAVRTPSTSSTGSAPSNEHATPSATLSETQNVLFGDEMAFYNRDRGSFVVSSLDNSAVGVEENPEASRDEVGKARRAVGHGGFAASKNASSSRAGTPTERGTGREVPFLESYNRGLNAETVAGDSISVGESAATSHNHKRPRVEFDAHPTAGNEDDENHVEEWITPRDFIASRQRQIQDERAQESKSRISPEDAAAGLRQRQSTDELRTESDGRRAGVGQEQLEEEEEEEYTCTERVAMCGMGVLAVLAALGITILLGFSISLFFIWAFGGW